MIHTRIDPELVRELAPESDVGVSDEVCQVMVEYLARELQIVSELIEEMGEDAKVNASDIRLFLALRGVNLCI